MFSGKSLSLLFAFVLTVFYASSQVTVWSETFDPPKSGWNITVSTGTNDPNANMWNIDDDEGGVAPGGCGVASNGDTTLHITSALIPTGGAAYDAGGVCGLLYCVTTNRRAESPNISTVGQSNLTLKFDYIGNGQAGVDQATVLYNCGSGWVVMDTLVAPTCGSGQGRWTAYSKALPACCNNIANLKIGFNWTNNDDGVGADPSVAINNIEITTPSGGTPPVADFSSSDTTFCSGKCISFTDLSTNSPTSWKWTFTGATPSSSTAQNPTSICYNTPGTYNVKLVATNASGSDSITKTSFITVNNCPTPTAKFASSDSTFCVGTCINFMDSSTNSPTSWQWYFPGGTPATSTSQNPSNVCYSAAGTYPVTLVVNNAFGQDSVTITSFITVNTCPTPVADFSSSDSTFCEGTCISFTNLTTNGTSYMWYFPGGTPATSTATNPTNICYSAAGVYDVTLVATNSNGTDSITKTGFITVNNCTPPIAGISSTATEICEDECITYSDNSTGATSWQWTFQGGTPSISNAQNPGAVCYNTPGTYTTKLIVNNMTGTDSTNITITVKQKPSVAAGMDQTIVSGGQAQLTASGNPAGGTYTWFPGIHIDCSSCQNTTASPEDTTFYIVTYTATNGCSAQDTLEVDVKFEVNWGIPNAFSPNYDGENDYLYVKGVGFESLNLQIFNRYGQLVFKTVDQKIGWDGKHNGKEVNPGVFVYYFNATFIDGSTVEDKGNITLTR